ncbi:MAG: YbaB/EbfC family nucleoid-associated protein [Bacilli bacterium]|nr:YbaB/EbfC family nucleoid-associated protein [Bacilli bacterium]
MNIQAMMAQAKKIQKEIEKTSEEIDSTIFNYENENILIECYGSNKIKSINIKNDEILEDKEMLGDILLVGINNIMDQISKTKEQKLGKYTNGLGGLF